MGTLYIVATPIGNLEDITFRAVKVLFSVDIIACEDTRRTGSLLDRLLDSHAELVSVSQTREGIPNQVRDDNIAHKPFLMSYYEQNELQRIPEIINLLQQGQNIALVSDAGTPLLSDPGFKLVRECLKEKIKVVPVPGASAPLAALVASGLPTDKFLFAGYPPRKPGHRMTFFENIKQSLESVKSTVILFEAPHKVVKTLTEMQEVFGDIELVLARELTKVHEEVKSRKISDHLLSFKKKEPRGEFVLLFHL